MATTPTTSDTPSLPFDPYDPKAETWEMFMERFDFFIIGNRLTNLAEKEKQAIFLNYCGKPVRHMARSIVSPQTMLEVDWSELKDKLQAHYAPKPSQISRRIKFYNRSQAEGESIADFIAELRSLAADCEFDTQLDGMLRDRLVAGLRDDKLKRRLISRPTLTLNTALEEALAAEANYPPSVNKRQSNVYQATCEGDSEEDQVEDGDIHLVKPTRGPKMAAKPHQTPCGDAMGTTSAPTAPIYNQSAATVSKKDTFIAPADLYPQLINCLEV